MALKLITPPAPVVTFAEAAAQLGITGTDKQVFVESLIASATEYLDGWKGILGQAIGSQTWELSLDSFPCGAIQLPLGPLISVSSVKHDDGDGVEQTVDSDNYDVDSVSNPGWVVPISGFSWPTTIDAINAVRVQFVAGFVPVPAPIKRWILLDVTKNFSLAKSDLGLSSENVEGVGSRGWTAGGSMLTHLDRAQDSLISPYRRIGL